MTRLIKHGVYTIIDKPDTVYILITKPNWSSTFIRLNTQDFNLNSIQKQFDGLVSGKQTHELTPFMSNFTTETFIKKYDGFLGVINLDNVRLEEI